MSIFNSDLPLKIIDLSTVLAGPSVGTFFAELGAEVIKIEHPNHQDVTRSWKLASENQDNAISAYFSSVNYQKKYTFLDLKASSDYQNFATQVKNAQVVLMNFKTESQKKLKVTEEDLWRINPNLIIGKISGFGTDSNRVAYDLILQAETGFMSMNGTPKSGPVKMPVALIDVLAAHQLKEGILLALLQQAHQPLKKGKLVEVSLYQSAISALANQASNFLMASHVPKRIGSLHPNIAPYGEIFKTQDQKLITFAIGTNLHFKKLTNYLGLMQLASDHRFSTSQLRVENRADLATYIQEKIEQLQAKEVLLVMEELQVPCAKIKNLSEVFENKQAQLMIQTESIGKQETKRVSQLAFSIK